MDEPLAELSAYFRMKSKVPGLELVLLTAAAREAAAVTEVQRNSGQPRQRWIASQSISWGKRNTTVIRKTLALGVVALAAAGCASTTNDSGSSRSASTDGNDVSGQCYLVPGNPGGSLWEGITTTRSVIISGFTVTVTIKGKEVYEHRFSLAAPAAGGAPGLGATPSVPLSIALPPQVPASLTVASSGLPAQAISPPVNGPGPNMVKGSDCTVNDITLAS